MRANLSKWRPFHRLATVGTLDALRNRGLSGRSYWITGPSGTGKTTIARLLAAEVAPDQPREEYRSAREFRAADLERLT